MEFVKALDILGELGGDFVNVARSQTDDAIACLKLATQFDDRLFSIGLKGCAVVALTDEGIDNRLPADSGKGIFAGRINIGDQC